MKTPTWAIVIGICMILFGGCSVTKHVQSINLPNIMSMQQEFVDQISSDSIFSSATDSLLTASEESDASREKVKQMSQQMKKMFSVSEFTMLWTVRFGYIGLFVALVYIFSGIFLMIRKEFSIKLVYGALGLSILFSIIQSYVLTTNASDGLLSAALGYRNIFGIIIDIVLLVIVMVMDKSDYNPQHETTELIDR